ncbi:hypothetical protein QUB30_31475 [Microcoleus sp. BROC3]
MLKTANRALLIKLIERDGILARELPIAPPTVELVFPLILSVPCCKIKFSYTTVNQSTYSIKCVSPN